VRFAHTPGKLPVIVVRPFGYGLRRRFSSRYLSCPRRLGAVTDAGRGTPAGMQRCSIEAVRPPVFRSNPSESVRVIERVGGVDRGCS
jgi:hypothetical protein